MGWKLLLWFWVGLVIANVNGWKDGTEYVYRIEGRTLSGHPDIGGYYSGIVMNADLIIRPKSGDVLMAKISKAQYARLQTTLPYGPEQQISEYGLKYQPLQFNQSPFQIKLERGVVTDVLVSKDVPNWEANIIKSIVSQLQLDTQAKNLIPSSFNQLPEEGSYYGTYKTMEDTVTGKYETLYELNPLPEIEYRTQPWLAPYPELKGDGEIIEIFKTKNFTNSDERVGYHYGLYNLHHWEPFGNKMGDFFVRSSTTRCIVSGHLDAYTLQSCVTANKIYVRPLLNSNENVAVISQYNLTLYNFQSSSSQFEELPSPQALGTLTYRYNNPFSPNNQPRSGKSPNSPNSSQSSSSSSSSSSEEQHQNNKYQSGQQNQENPHNQNKRFSYKGLYYSSSSSESSQSSSSFSSQSSSSSSSSDFSSISSDESDWQQEAPGLSDAPHSPLLPMNIGYMGKSIKFDQNVNVVQALQKLCYQIGQDLENPDSIPKKQTLSRFVIMTSLMRVMNEKELQEATNALYTKEYGTAKSYAWSAYRDALAECGTGPAFLSLQSLIESQKLSLEIAAQVIAQMAQSVRQPTSDYMRAFYTFSKKPEILAEPFLNSSTVLAYAELVRKVYVNKRSSHNQYPVHSFGSFRNKEGVTFVHEKYIPYLKQQLDQAIAEYDYHKAQIYTRALGLVAHQQILNVFEPYLEGKQQATQFQRLQMVLALDVIAEESPKLARSLLYKIYQNSGENQDVRVAAVFNLMKTRPSATMLQRMAQYTHIDQNEYVNAVVKSAIQTAAQLQDEQYSDVRANAQAAESLLSSNDYGLQYSGNYFSSYEVNGMNFNYKQDVQVIGSNDSFIPKAIKYKLRANVGGVEREILDFQYMFNSLDAFADAFYHETQRYSQQQQQYKKNSNKGQNQWSSETVARILNIQSNRLEEMEGNIRISMGGAQKYYTFDKQFVYQIAQEIHQIGESLASGRNFQYTKFVNHHDVAISFPAETGFPVIYTLENPTLINIEGHVAGEAQPKFSSGGKFYTPDFVNVTGQVNFVISKKVEGRLGFVTPFESHHYLAGFDKNMQVHVPVRVWVEANIKEDLYTGALEAIEPQQNVRSFHYCSLPYTSWHNIADMQPLVGAEHTQAINTEPNTIFNEVFGDEAAGVAFRVGFESEKRNFDFLWFYEQFQRHDAVSILMAPWYDESVHYSQLNVEYDAEHSANHHLKFQFGYRQDYVPQPQSQEETDISHLVQTSNNSKERQQIFFEKAPAGIRNAKVTVVDAYVGFKGQEDIDYTATFAVAKSPVDEISRILFSFNKQPNNKQKYYPYQVVMAVKNHIPNTNGLDPVFAFKFDPKSTIQAQLAFGENYESSAKVNLHGQLNKSQYRLQYLQRQTTAKECDQQTSQGNYQLPACENLTANANLLDQFTVQLQYQKMTPQNEHLFKKLFNAARSYLFFNAEKSYVAAPGSGGENQLNINGQFHYDFRAINISTHGNNKNIHFNNVRINEWVKPLLSVHPVFRAKDRMLSYAYALPTYRPSCVVDQSAVATLDNTVYPIDLGNSWTVMLLYTPVEYDYEFYQQQSSSYSRHRHHQKHRQQQQPEQQQHQQQQQQHQQGQYAEQYVVLVRNSKKYQSQKEVKISLSVPNTQGQQVEIDITPNEPGRSGSGYSPKAQVAVNQKKQQISDQKATDVYNDYIQIYSLPNGEVKVAVADAFYVLYDGARARLTVTNSEKFKNAIRGLCGTFDGQQYTDFTGPHNCIYHNAQAFVNAYQLESSRQNQNQQGQNPQYTCTHSQVGYANVVSNRDAGRPIFWNTKYGQGQQQFQHGGCTKHQTQYTIDESGKVCFTVKALPVCKKGCKAGKYIYKSVPVHCIDKGRQANLYMKQIDKGASPDFGIKEITKNIKFKVAQSCSAY